MCTRTWAQSVGLDKLSPCAYPTHIYNCALICTKYMYTCPTPTHQHTHTHTNGKLLRPKQMPMGPMCLHSCWLEVYHFNGCHICQAPISTFLQPTGNPIHLSSASTRGATKLATWVGKRWRKSNLRANYDKLKLSSCWCCTSTTLSLNMRVHSEGFQKLLGLW